MAHPKVDPGLLEREYVTTDISLRELARRHDLSWSALAARARKPDDNGLTWSDKRQSYRESVAMKTYEKTADRFAAEQADIRNEMIMINRATLALYAEELRAGNIKVTPKDAVEAVKSLLLLLGEPTARSESQIVDFTASGLGGPEFLRELVKAARAKVIEGTVAEPAGPVSERTFQN